MTQLASRSMGSILVNEPFRLFFPTAALVSVLGVSLWPLVYAGWLPFYPGEAHARLMIEGFVGGFAIGFLGTALPKEIECPPLSGLELLTLYLTYLATVWFHLNGQILLGDSLFIATWVLLLGGLAVRFLFFRKDLPPPGFIVALIGILSGVAGTLLLILYQFQLNDLFSRLGKLLLYEAFILGPIIGVGSFLFLRFFNTQLSNSKNHPTWYQTRPAHLIAGVLIFTTFFFQAWGWEKTAPIIRSLLVAIYLYLQMIRGKRLAIQGPLSVMLSAALGFVAIGILISTFGSHSQVAFKHLLFISGYGLIILTIATRVIGGHSGLGKTLFSRKRTLFTLLAFVVLATGTRIIADIIPAIRISHHIYASLCWIICVGIWSVAVLKYITTVDLDS